jgi:hypothetical protein
MPDRGDDRGANDGWHSLALFSAVSPISVWTGAHKSLLALDTGLWSRESGFESPGPNQLLSHEVREGRAAWGTVLGATVSAISFQVGRWLG